MSTEDYRTEPEKVPPCPRCGGTSSEHDESYPLLPWWCPDCSTAHKGSLSEAATHAARVIADAAVAADLANKPSTLKALREER